jgi:hypothetical protein
MFCHRWTLRKILRKTSKIKSMQSETANSHLLCLILYSHTFSIFNSSSELLLFYRIRVSFRYKLPEQYDINVFLAKASCHCYLFLFILYLVFFSQDSGCLNSEIRDANATFLIAKLCSLRSSWLCYTTKKKNNSNRCFFFLNSGILVVQSGTNLNLHCISLH